MSLETTRLLLEPFTPARLHALLDGGARFEALTGRRLAEGLAEMYGSGDVSPDWLARLRDAPDPDRADPWVHGFALVERTSGMVIGSAGFKGAPDGAGRVEIAYGVAPAYQGRGVATEAAGALVAYALADARVRLVVAHTLPEANASTRVLGRCGFAYVGEVVDPEDGVVWRWERAR